MKRILFLVVIALAAALAGGAYWYRSGMETRTATSRWLAHPLDKVKSVHIRQGGDAYTLVADNRHWAARIPGASWNVTAGAVDGRVRDYLNRLVGLVPLLVFEGDEVAILRQYGLNEPGLTLALGSGGEGSPALNIRFARGGSDKTYGWNSETPGRVYEFGGEVFGQFAHPATHFLDTRVFRFDEERVSQVQLVQPFGSSWVARRGPGGFTFVLPGYLKGKEVSGSELKLYLHALALLRAGKLVLEPAAPEKSMAALTVKVWTGNAKEPSSVEFFTLEDDPKQYFGRSSRLTVPFLLDAESVSQLVKSAFDVQDRDVFTLDIGQVAVIVIINGDRRYVVRREHAGWRVEGGEKDIPGIDMALWRFTELQFEALPLNNLAATAVKLMHCRLLDGDGNELKAVTFYADPVLPQGQCWIKNGDGMYYPVSARLLKDLQGMFPAGEPGKTE